MDSYLLRTPTSSCLFFSFPSISPSSLLFPPPPSPLPPSSPPLSILFLSPSPSLCPFIACSFFVLVVSYSPLSNLCYSFLPQPPPSLSLPLLPLDSHHCFFLISMSALLDTPHFVPDAPVKDARIDPILFLLQEREKDIVWFREHFYGRPHYTYLTVHSPLGPLIVSLIADPRQCYRALIRSTSGSVRISLPASVITLPWWRKRLGLPATGSTVLAAMTDHLPIKCLRPCGDGRLPKEILRMEERMVIRCHKFGIGYLAPGQVTEKEMLSNDLDHCSPGFLSFLSFLGKRIPLQGWKGYDGGLDCRCKSGRS